MFTSRFVDEQCEITPLLTENLCSYKTIFEIMREHNNEDMSFEEFKQFALADPSIGGYLNKLDEECDKYDFLYAYSTEPDHMLHEFGSGSSEVSELIKVIDKGIEVISKRHPDVLFVIVADHGHIICENRSLYEHEDFFSCLKSPQFSVEGRAAAFYVKDDKKEEFRKLATKYYGEDFDIYSKEEVKKLKIFGLGKEHPRFDYAIGDFLLVAKSNKVFTQDFGAFLFSHHAGGTDLEKYINLSIINE